jgi:hypothetical protein
MNISTLQQFRHDIYLCFWRAKDALFDMADALLTETQAQSFASIVTFSILPAEMA